MKSIITNNIGIDPLTGLRNFFEFIQSDSLKLFKESGCVVVFDIEGFRKINEAYGTTLGDRFLIELARVIDEKVNFRRFEVFRTDGDEFTIIMPNISLVEGVKFREAVISEIYNEIKNKYDKEISIHTIIIRYDMPVESIDDFYATMFSDESENVIRSSEKFEVNICSQQIIKSLTRRIRETLTLFDKACYLALTDDISGLKNHRAAMIQLESIKAESDKYGTKFSILFMDGDNLKKYNDISYEEGNKMIRKLADLIKANIRCNDNAYRWLSGDEFVVVLQDTNCEEARRIAERIRHAVQEESKEWIYPVTVSIGVSSYPCGGSLDEAIEMAQNGSTMAKKCGKNKVILSGRYKK